MLGRLAAVVALMVLSACSTVGSAQQAGRPPNSRPGTWRELPSAPRGLNPGSMSVWIGDELVVWSKPGAIYNAERDSWRTLPAPPGGRHPGGGPVWTGKEVLSWSIANSLGDRPTNEGLAYNPETNAWRLLLRAPISGRISHQSIWTGTEMIVWGGMDQCCAIDSYIHQSEAAAFNPTSNTWRRLRDVPSPVSGDDGRADSLAVGDTMLVWRGQRLSAYDIDRDRWSSLARPSFSSERCGMTGGPASVATVVDDTVFTWSGSCQTRWGRAFDINGERWRRTADAPIDIWSLAPRDGTVYATGRPYSDVMADRAAVWSYDIRRDRWTQLPKPSQPLALGAFITWTGSEVLLWGGWLGKDIPPTGAAYTPN